LLEESLSSPALPSHGEPTRLRADQWLEAWQKEHLLIAAGRDRYVFVHSTIMELLAARDILQRLAPQPGDDPEEIRDALADRSRDSLEVLPVLCGHHYETGWRVLERLERVCEPSPPDPGRWTPSSTLPLRGRRFISCC
jgi:hypothetical protein